MSTRRPGVAMTTSGSYLNCISYLIIEVFPMIRQALNLEFWLSA